MLATAAPACAGSPPNGRLTLRKIIIPTAIKASTHARWRRPCSIAYAAPPPLALRALLELLILMAQKRSMAIISSRRRARQGVKWLVAASYSSLASKSSRRAWPG